MSNLQLANALREKRLVLFVGSGVTRDAGLPDWAGLVASLTRQLSETGELAPKVAEAADLVASTGELAGAIQIVLSQAPRSAVITRLRSLLTPPAASQVVDALAGWHPRGVVTTNFDREVERLVGTAAYRLNNSEASLKLVPWAVGSSSPFIWKLHGDLDDLLDPSDSKVAAGGGFMVLSRPDFAALVQGDRGRQLLAGLISVLQTYSVLFVGYSFSDPDIHLLLSWLAENCQFAHPSWFVTRVGESAQLPPNVQFMAPIANWEELVPWVQSVSDLAGGVPAAPAAERGRPAPSVTAYLTISRYLSDLEAPGNAERVLAAALFDELADRKDFGLSWLASRVAEVLGLGPTFAANLARATARLLAEYGLVERDGETIHMREEAGQQLRERATAAWEREREDFFRSAERRLPAGSASLAPAVRDALEATLLEMCSELGESMAEWVSQGTGGDIGFPSLDSQLEDRLNSDEDRRRAASLLRLVLANPRDLEIPYLHRLLSATFLANTVRLNPVAAAQLRETLGLYELYLDANVLLPFLVEEHPKHDATRVVIEDSRRAGVKLSVLTSILNEVQSHRELARRDFLDLGGDVRQLSTLASALGSRANVFLEGFLRYRPSGQIGSQGEWRTYLARYTNRAISEKLRAAGISETDPDPEASAGPLYSEALAAIREEWTRRVGTSREDVLNVHEAMQVAHIYLRRERTPERRDHIWFLSNETVLQRVFERQPSRWLLPATFPYSAWVAFLDSRFPHIGADSGAIVKAILHGRVEAFELPSPMALVRQRAFGDRVTSREEEDALGFAMSDFTLMRRVEAAQRAVSSRAHPVRRTQELAAARQEAVGEIAGALDAEMARLRKELTRARVRIGELVARQSELSSGESSSRRSPRRRPGHP